jgi:hypothetical protein
VALMMGLPLVTSIRFFVWLFYWFCDLLSVWQEA